MTTHSNQDPFLITWILRETINKNYVPSNKRPDQLSFRNKPEHTHSELRADACTLIPRSRLDTALGVEKKGKEWTHPSSEEVGINRNTGHTCRVDHCCSFWIPGGMERPRDYP